MEEKLNAVMPPAVMTPAKKILKDIKAVHLNYSIPVQTGINQWSVFVRKFDNEDWVGVIEHRFKNQEDAKTFSCNNWNLGDYF